ncbi:MULTISPECIES: hypothetical protein [Burkholderiaceae]|uniref:hypothetical protein n=1 Tax=Burkholderiaceae TaxID=119060 RepID=UPI001421FEC7|nr:MULTISPECIES: hypothetical protein [Burkholderiaceae]NIF52220.1 hypothetical protein [Burkholderia sp. Ax-1724]NIF81318.1 hypothetical protein [Paraburkholderia sp. Cy-641]
MKFAEVRANEIMPGAISVAHVRPMHGAGAIQRSLHGEFFKHPLSKNRLCALCTPSQLLAIFH